MSVSKWCFILWVWKRLFWNWKRNTLDYSGFSIFEHFKPRNRLKCRIVYFVWFVSQNTPHLYFGFKCNAAKQLRLYLNDLWWIMTSLREITYWKSWNNDHSIVFEYSNFCSLNFQRRLNFQIVSTLGYLHFVQKAFLIICF